MDVTAPRQALARLWGTWGCRLGRLSLLHFRTSITLCPRATQLGPAGREDWGDPRWQKPSLPARRSQPTGAMEALHLPSTQALTAFTVSSLPSPPLLPPQSPQVHLPHPSLLPSNAQPQTAAVDTALPRHSEQSHDSAQVDPVPSPCHSLPRLLTPFQTGLLFWSSSLSSGLSHIPRTQLGPGIPHLALDLTASLSDSPMRRCTL